MKPDYLRLILGPLGLFIGFVIYGQALSLEQPWQSIVIGGFFVVLGVTAWVYAKGERWIQVLGVILMLYGLARAIFLQ